MRATNESGMAVVIVVTVIAMLTIIVMEFTYAVTLDQFRVRNSLNALQSELIVRSGVNLAEGFLALDDDHSVDTFMDEWYFRMQQFCQHLELPNGAVVRCDIKDESGKININNTRVPPAWVPGTESPQSVLLQAMQCIFQGREGIDVRIPVEHLPEYWQRPGAELADGTQRADVRQFNSVEHFAATFNIPTRHIAYLRQYLTAQPHRQLRGVNINTASPEVLSVLIDPRNCGGAADISEIISRREDLENPIRQAEIRGLLGGVEYVQSISNLFVSNSSLYRIEASAITNPNPDNPQRGGVGKTLSVLVHRQCAETTPEGCERWTFKPLDWQKEGGARLFRERNRFSGLAEQFGEFDPTAVGQMFQ